MKARLLIFFICLFSIFMAISFTANAGILEDAKFALAQNQPLTLAMKAAIEEEAKTASQDYNELDRTGGPDDDGYEFIDSAEPNGPEFEWIDLANSEDATQITGWGDDTASGPLAIGFDFPFYGEDKSDAWGTSNGLLGFNSASMTSYSNINAPSTNAPNDLIMPWWDDMHGGYGCTFTYYETMEWEDGRDAFVYEVNHLPYLGGGNNINMSVSYEVILFDNGEIRIQYGYLGANLRHASTTIGIENSTGTVGLSYCYNNLNNEPEEETVIAFGQTAAGPNLIGVATNILNGQPLEFVVVDVYNADTNEFFKSDTSDSLGNYVVRELLPGEYYLRANLEGYVELYIDDIVAEEPTNFSPPPIERNLQMQAFIEVDMEEIKTEVPQDTWVRTTGIITVPPNTISFDNSIFYLQDETGYGVSVYGPDPWDPEDIINRGDEVMIVGRVNQYDDITEITDLYLYEIISSDNAIPDPIEMQTGSMSQMNDMEGSWALITGYLQNEIPEDGNYTFLLNDGSGDCSVRIWAATDIDLTDWTQGDWLMVQGVINLYEGSVQLLPSLRADVFRTPMIAPDFSRSSVDDTTGIVTIKWDHTAFGPIGKLTYDHGAPAGYYPWPGSKMATRMSPAAECRLLAIQYYVWTEETANFNAQIYNWDAENGTPTETPFRDINVELDPYQGWHEVLFSDENIMLDEDFVVAFDSYNNDVRLAVNFYDNGRGWDRDIDYGWNPWIYTYFIRAVVQYGNGALGEFGNGGNNGGELDEWQNFSVYRDGEAIGTTRWSTYTDTLQDNGTYEYTITANYHEGETEHSDIETVTWGAVDVVETRQSNVLPTSWSIESVYPNPFNSTINVSVGVPASAYLNVEIFDILGRKVAVLDAGKVEPGHHHLRWEANGPAGIYFMNVSSSSGWHDIRKLVYLK